MPRPQTPRAVSHEVKVSFFKPAGIPARELDELALSLDELEAIKAADLLGLYQEAAARELGVSRQTFGRILESAHRKIADALLNGKALRIEGGSISPCKRKKTMKLALALTADPNENKLEDHFGQCIRLGILAFDQTGKAEEQKELAVPETLGCRSSLAPMLARNGVTHLLVGRLGNGVKNSFESHGIKVVAGLSGSVESALAHFQQGIFQAGAGICGCGAGHDHQDSDHHGECGHGADSHGHGDHSCGCGGH